MRMSKPIWTPSPERIAASHLTRFADYARREHGAPVGRLRGAVALVGG